VSDFADYDYKIKIVKIFTPSILGLETTDLVAVGLASRTGKAEETFYIKLKVGGMKWRRYANIELSIELLQNY